MKILPEAISDFPNPEILRSRRMSGLTGRTTAIAIGINDRLVSAVQRLMAAARTSYLLVTSAVFGTLGSIQPSAAEHENGGYGLGAVL